MKIYIVFKHVLAWHKDMVIDSVWRSLPAAYERMEMIKEGGRIEVHDLDKIKDGDDTCQHCGCYNKLQRKIQRIIYSVKNHSNDGNDALNTMWVLHELEKLKGE